MKPRCRWCAREPGDVAAKRAARLEARERLVDDLRPDRVVADEGDVAAVRSPSCRLAGVVKQRAEPERVAAGELVAERLREERAHLVGALACVALEIALDDEELAQHLDRVAVDVQVVVRVLLDAAQRLELRQDAGGRPELVQEIEAAHGIVGAR